MAAVFCACFRLRAIDWRNRDRGTRSSRLLLLVAGLAGLGCNSAACTSPLVSRPLRPLADRLAGSICGASASIFATAGPEACPLATVAAPLPLWLAAGGGAAAAVAALGTAGAAAAEVAAAGGAAGADAAPSPSATRAKIAPTSTVAPSSTRASKSVPATGEGTSSVTLSVSNSSRFSSTATASPGFLSQLATVPSVTDSPSSGTRISVAMCVLPLLFKSIQERVGDVVRHVANVSRTR